ncbi:hypothetical protein [Acidisoma sp. L85]|jgi:hypothetical protein|uniref:hypothetical protein n=1 Tax=Acidisoma sp. L85 TaxID=1641850 RepID=UPI00131D4536|nr:hypothetical protein [Acidisoma sp. L85]
MVNTVIGAGLEDDEDVWKALEWFAIASGKPSVFTERLSNAQQAYRAVTAAADSFGQDPGLETISQDVVGAFLAQAKSLIDDRRSYDIALGSRIVPWVKQIGRNAHLLRQIPGAVERAARMLRTKAVAPDGAMFELLMASNYAANGFDVAFIQEAKGQERTPDLQLSLAELTGVASVECKRLGRGKYDMQEQATHREIFRSAAALMYNCRLSVHLDVTYTEELEAIPSRYLEERLMRVISSAIITPNGYPWKDDFGFGVVKRANLPAVHRDIHDNGSLYFGTKLARLLCGHSVRETGYHLAAQADPDELDPRFIRSISYGSVVTWQCAAPTAIEKKARYVKTKLVEADRQLEAHGLGIAHLAMDMESQCESSDLRRTRNIEAIQAFKPSTALLAVYLHYLVPRISESHSWTVDETIDRFGPRPDLVPSLAVFPGSAPIGNDLPAWRQET